MTDDYDPMPPPDVIERLAKDCRCCQACGSVPCDGVMAGGMCDEARCSCDDEPSDRDDDEDGYPDSWFHPDGDVGDW